MVYIDLLKKKTMGLALKHLISTLSTSIAKGEIQDMAWLIDNFG